MIKMIKKKLFAKQDLDMRKTRKKLGDRGAALVSVLIAITFIAIIATSLLYMVYMNYLTKVMRHGSTDNFYTAEFALDDLSSEMQQIAVDQGLAGKGISDAVKKIRSEVGASSSSSRYDNDKVAALIKVASKEAVIDVDTSYPAGVNNYEDAATYVKLKGVKITSRDEKGYISTITSDITIKFHPEGEGELDICDFSVLTDAPVYIGGGDFIMTGCGYMQKDPDGNAVGVGIKSGSTTIPAGYCLVIDNGACVQMLSERAILNGKVQIKGNSVMTVSGKVYVFGDLEMSANSTLIVTGDLKITGSLKDNGGKVLKKETDSIETGWTYPGGDKCPLQGGSTKKGLVRQLFCTRVPFWNTYSGTAHVDYFDFNQFYKDSENGRTSASEAKTSHDGTELMLQICSPDVNNSAFENALALCPNKICYVNGTCVNSTVVSLYGYAFNGMSQTTPSYMQRMDPEQYNWFINSCLGYNKNAESKLRADGGQMKMVKEDGTDLGGAEIKMPKLGTQMPTSPAGYIKETYTYSGDPRVWYHDSDGVTYIPIKYLLDDNTSAIITEVFDSVSNSSDPTRSTVIYDNWDKE